MNREIRSYDYVNHPYAAVRDALVKDPAGVLRAATNAAASRARAVAAALHVNIGPLDIGAEIAVTVGKISEQTHDAPMSRVTRIPIEWSAAAARRTVSHHERRVVGVSADGNGNPARLSGPLRTAARHCRRCARCNGGTSHRRGVCPSPCRGRRELSARAREVVLPQNSINTDRGLMRRRGCDLDVGVAPGGGRSRSAAG